MSGSADLHKAIASLWISSGLHALFQAKWNEADRSIYATLNDAKAAPGTPFPYVVFEATQPSIDARMSGSGRQKYHVDDQTWTFSVYAIPEGSKSSKVVASELGDEILKVFGGHSTEEPQANGMELNNGRVLLVQYQYDHFERQADNVWKWSVEYKIKTDKPVMV